MKRITKEELELAELKATAEELVGFADRPEGQDPYLHRKAFYRLFHEWAEQNPDEFAPPDTIEQLNSMQRPNTPD